MLRLTALLITLLPALPALATEALPLPQGHYAPATERCMEAPEEAFGLLHAEGFDTDGARCRFVAIRDEGNGSFRFNETCRDPSLQLETPNEGRLEMLGPDSFLLHDGRGDAAWRLCAPEDLPPEMR